MAKRSKKGGIEGITLKINKRNPEATNVIPLIDIKTIPNSIGEEKLNILTEGDEDPYFFAQAIQFPIEANGDVYDIEFAQSFVERNKEQAYPGDKYGHSLSWYSRQPTHFYQVGSIMVGNVAWFKFYVPPSTDSESNESFKKEIKTNGIDLSLVSKAKYQYNQDDEKYHMVASVGGERNDAVGFGDGSMDQIVINKKNENIEEGLEVTKEELLKKLNTQFLNGEITVQDIMKVLNKSDMLKSEKDTADLKVLNSLVAVLGDKPLEKVTELSEAVKLNADVLRKNMITEEFGKEGTKEEPNLVRNMAELLLKDKVINAESLKVVREDATFLKIAGEQADVNKQVLNKETGGDSGTVNSLSMEL
jgi:hypothetical protein